MANKWIDIEIDGISGQYCIKDVKEDVTTVRLIVRRVQGNNVSSTNVRFPKDGIISTVGFNRKVKEMLEEIMEIEEGLWD